MPDEAGDVRERESTLVVVGDMEIDRPEPRNTFSKVASYLDAADMRFGGLEASMSHLGEPATGKIVMRHDPEMIQGYLEGGFDALAFASNHCMDYGVEPFVETMELLERNGIAYSGAGRNIQEARTPAVLERGGVRYGFLSYVLELPLGWGAGPAKPGVAPIRQDALYGPPYVNEEDLEAMIADVVRARPRVDFLLASFHWGASQSRTLTLSQQAVAHAAIEAGADVVIGHHPHIVQGVEVYRGRPVFYALGNFVLDHDHPMFLPTARESICLKLTLRGGALGRAAISPVLIEADGSPRILGEEEPKSAEILGTLESLSIKLGTRLKISQGEGIVAL